MLTSLSPEHFLWVRFVFLQQKLPVNLSQSIHHIDQIVEVIEFALGD